MLRNSGDGGDYPLVELKGPFPLDGGRLGWGRRRLSGRAKRSESRVSPPRQCIEGKHPLLNPPPSKEEEAIIRLWN